MLENNVLLTCNRKILFTFYIIFSQYAHSANSVQCIKKLYVKKKCISAIGFFKLNFDVNASKIDLHTDDINVRILNCTILQS